MNRLKVLGAALSTSFLTSCGFMQSYEGSKDEYLCAKALDRAMNTTFDQMQSLRHYQPVPKSNVGRRVADAWIDVNHDNCSEEDKRRNFSYMFGSDDKFFSYADLGPNGEPSMEMKMRAIITHYDR